MMKKWSALGGLAFAAILGSVFAFPAYAKEKPFQMAFYAGDFALGGLTKEQAEEQFASYVSALEERSITLDVVGNKVETTAKILAMRVQTRTRCRRRKSMPQAAA